MALMDKRIWELALKGLEAERDLIVSEIEVLRARLGGRVAKARRRRAVKGIRNEVAATAASLTKTVRRRKTAKKRWTLSTAQRRAISDRMKKTWARRRKKAGK